MCRRRAHGGLLWESAAKTGVAERPERKTRRGARWDKIEVRWREVARAAKCSHAAF